ncbi:MAG: universal stress protein [Candidatus Omnitrophota bacterium]
MYKSVLLAVDASRYSEVCMRYALEYSKWLGAQITILSVVDRKEFAIVYPYYYPTADFPPVFDESVFEKNELLSKQWERAENLLNRIQEECRKAGLTARCEIREGIVTDMILEEAKCCDLLFLGQRGAGADFSTGLLGSNLESVIRRSDIPVIVTPHSYRTLQRILVCFDGGEYSVKTLRSAAHLYACCPHNSIKMKLLVVHEDEIEARQVADKALKYLDAYQLRDILEIRQGDPAEQIVAAAKEDDVDLVAMGAYGHARVRELVLGSTTECVLRNINRAVLLQH